MHNILIVDDEKSICDLLSAELTEHGYRCTCVLEAEAALKVLNIESYQLMLLDLMMPGMSGIDLLKQLRNSKSETKVIVVTAVNDIDTAVSAMKLGASDFITKPFALKNVVRSVSAVLQSASMRKSISDMDAIALGVELKQELVDDHWEAVTRKTVDIAHRLGIPDEEINAWVEARKRAKHERDSRLLTSLNGP